LTEDIEGELHPMRLSGMAAKETIAKVAEKQVCQRKSCIGPGLDCK